MPNLHLWAQILTICIAGPILSFIITAAASVAHRKFSMSGRICTLEERLDAAEAALELKNKSACILETRVIELEGDVRLYQDTNRALLTANRRLRERLTKNLERIAELSDALSREQHMRMKADEAVNVLKRVAKAEDGEYVERMVYGMAGVPI